MSSAKSKLVVGVLCSSIVAVVGVTHVYLPFYSDISERRRAGEDFGVGKGRTVSTNNGNNNGNSMWKNMKEGNAK